MVYNGINSKQCENNKQIVKQEQMKIDACVDTHIPALLSLQVKHLPVNGYVELSKERSVHVFYGCRFFIQVKLALLSTKLLNLFQTCQFCMIGCGTNISFRFSIQIRTICNHASFAEKGFILNTSMLEYDRSFFFII